VLQTEFSQFMKNLRVDETAARKKVDELKNELITTDRMLHKANIPGVPEEMDARLEEAEERLFVAMKSLREVPLNMQQVGTDVDIAANVIAETREKAVEMIENVHLIEQIIQYGNRYRKTDARMNARLLEAEESFRQLRYSKALEEAATAVEAVEPGAMKRIEVLKKQNA
ncbi:septation ring formation regulator EzrA, partial [Indiicoccus explosivorum]|uniref:septation ring formation regulator EzrA n=1 Tax=Indiicoccus explosivorum TaxID=1917864 RepID=UPI00240A432E